MCEGEKKGCDRFCVQPRLLSYRGEGGATLLLIVKEIKVVFVLIACVQILLRFGLSSTKVPCRVQPVFGHFDPVRAFRQLSDVQAVWISHTFIS